ncbi:MAG: sigma-54-dependent Fis family transcriptional regulator [Acidobacteria bacterium]|nr:sigma-54-dependent Fis family transcriptional regulator [Acidobacteriota bacterium]
MSVLSRPQDVRLVGRSEAIRLLETDIECAARSDAKVLVTGETGVGKEVVARLIHQRGTRASAPLVTLNCAGLPDSLLESELFGHARGSFTGAYRDKPGLLEMAPNGTVFLDEVGEMSTRMQVVLLRFLESGEIQRVGADRVQGRVNVRLITATNRDLQQGIQAGTFREDLYFRLNVIRIAIPPLRDRVEDIPLLVDYYAKAYSQAHRVPPVEVLPDALDVLTAYRWPGNVRELKNVVERIVLKTAGQPARASDLPVELLRGVTPARAAATTATPAPLSRADELAARMLAHGESFWAAVYPQFMSRDMTRADLRRIVQIGLEQTSGNYRSLVQLFNMPLEDYKRFLSFLRKHDCHLPFQRFRTVPARLQPAQPEMPAASGDPIPWGRTPH